MINLDSELAKQYLTDCHDRILEAETALTAAKNNGKQTDKHAVTRAFRAVHSVKGGASFFDLVTIGNLACQTDDALSLIRTQDIALTPKRMDTLLQSLAKLRELLQHAGTSNQANISQTMKALSDLCSEPIANAAADLAAAPKPADPKGKPLRMLLVEDDFASRLLLQIFLSRYGECHVAVNGREAVDAFRAAAKRDERYDLICMDIMMPEMDGHEAVRQVRAMEEADGIFQTRSKIIMTTTVNDVKEVVKCFQELCDAYLMKPIHLNNLLNQMKAYQLID